MAGGLGWRDAGKSMKWFLRALAVVVVLGVLGAVGFVAMKRQIGEAMFRTAAMKQVGRDRSADLADGLQVYFAARARRCRILRATGRASAWSPASGRSCSMRDRAARGGWRGWAFPPDGSSTSISRTCTPIISTGWAR